MTKNILFKTPEEQIKYLEQSNRELEDFAHIASHDLRQPLRGIRNLSQFLLEDNEKKLDKESVSRLHKLMHLTQRMEKIINDLLNFSCLDRQDLAIEKADLNEVVKDIEATIEIFLEENKAKISVAYTLPVITCDKVRVTEALRNLITNAVKYNDKDIKNVEIGFLRKGPQKDGTEVKNIFYVKDNGYGIDPEFYDEIFRLFKRLPSPVNKDEEGTGAGLTFVKKIVEQHGGKIWLESERGKGSTFYFTLNSDE